MNTERIKRRLRQRMFNYTETKQEQAGRMISRCKARMMPIWEAQHKDRRKAAGEAYVRVMWM